MLYFLSLLIQLTGAPPRPEPPGDRLLSGLYKPQPQLPRTQGQPPLIRPIRFSKEQVREEKIVLP